MYVPMPITDIALPLRHGMLYKNQSQVLQKCLTTTIGSIVSQDRDEL